MLSPDQSDIQNKPNQRVRSISDLSKELDIPIYVKNLSIPGRDKCFESYYTDLEKKFRFAWGVDSGDNYLVFVSNQTDLLGLSQYFPFLFESYQLYLCDHRLISERLYYYANNKTHTIQNHVTRFWETTLNEAILRKATDIHFEETKEGRRIRLRIDGVLKVFDDCGVIPEGLDVKLKLISGMDIAIRRTPQDGSMEFLSHDGSRYDLRLSTIPGIFGEKMVIRILATDSVDMNLAKLNFSEKFIQAINHFISLKTGLLIVAGPTGSGKSTTLYAVLKQLISQEINIITIEDPVEYRFDQVTQVEVNEKAGVTFSKALRSSLRQDPDVILIGEIRDRETAEIAVKAAQTGHLVLSTLHSNDVFGALQRLRGLEVNDEDMASSLKLLVSQRLAPKICPCNKDQQCPECHGLGLKGRLPIVEYLVVDKEIRTKISKNWSAEDIRTSQNDFVSLKKYAQLLCEEKLIDYNILAQL